MIADGERLVVLAREGRWYEDRYRWLRAYGRGIGQAVIPAWARDFRSRLWKKPLFRLLMLILKDGSTKAKQSTAMFCIVLGLRTRKLLPL